MNSIFCIDKPSGITSFDVIRQLRRRFRQAQPDIKLPKMGHAGTLDPLATGLLIIGVGEATKELSRYMGLAKEYEVVIEFGRVSTTYDGDGVISKYEIRKIQKNDFESVLKNFIGEISQMPPQFSAKRINGRRAYDLARRGEHAALKPVKVFIENIEIIEWNWPEVALRVRCGKGTYIRSLAHDLGQMLGCGGYVKELRRTRIGEWKVEEAEKLEFLI